MILKIRRLFCFCAYHLGLVFVGLLLVRTFRRKHVAAVLMYHRIVSAEDEYLDKGPSFHRPLDQFESEVLFLSKWFNLITLD